MLTHGSSNDSGQTQAPVTLAKSALRRWPRSQIQMVENALSYLKRYLTQVLNWDSFPLLKLKSTFFLLCLITRSSSLFFRWVDDFGPFVVVDTGREPVVHNEVREYQEDQHGAYEWSQNREDREAV